MKAKRKAEKSANPAPISKLCRPCLKKKRLVVASDTLTGSDECTWCVMGQEPPVSAVLTKKQWEAKRRKAARKAA